MRSKSQMRSEFLTIRNSIKTELKEKWDKEIYDNLINSQEYKTSKYIFIYVSVKNEVNTIPIINKALSDNKIVAVPKVIPQQKIMSARIIENIDSLVSGYYGIPEPSLEAEIMEPSIIDLIVIPGVAFDKTGGRLGYGGGYYDKYLKEEIKAHRVGICYLCQLADRIPLEENDKLVSKLITNNI